MKPTDKNNKGRQLELKVAQLIRRKGLDKAAKRMHRSGALSHRPADIFTSLPIHIEAKNQERIQIWPWWEKTRSKAKFGKDPVLIISGEHRPILAVVDIEYLLNLLKVEQQYLGIGK